MKKFGLLLILAISTVFLISCGDGKKDQNEKDAKSNDQSEMIDNDELVVSESGGELKKEPVNLAEHNENYQGTMILPEYTPIVSLEFSGTFSGAFEGDFSTKYIQIQIKDPYVFINMYKGNLDLQFVKDSLMERYDDNAPEIIEESENSFIFKKSQGDTLNLYSLYAKKTVNSTPYFINTGFDVYNFDRSERVNYTLEDAKYMLSVFNTLKETPEDVADNDASEQ